MNTTMSRFQIHDELTAPERSAAVLHGASAGGGQLPNFLGALAGSPAALRGYVHFRSELRHGQLSPATTERIALAVASRHRAAPELAAHARQARGAGLSLDEIALAREFDSAQPREAALLRYLKSVIEDGCPPLHLHERARELGWDDEQLIEAIAQVALESFIAMLQVAGEVPLDGRGEQPRLVRAA